MKRMSLAIAATVLAVGLSGCGQGDPEPTDPATPTEEAPTADASITADNLPGTWEAPDVEWVVHFNPDGTFVEDFQGNEGMRSGDWEVDGATVTLIGGDGNDDSGTIEGETIEFQLGTLERTS